MAPKFKIMRSKETILSIILILTFAFPIIGQKVVIDNPDIIKGRLVKVTKPLRDFTEADNIKPTFPERRSMKLGYHPKGDWILHEKTNPDALPQGLDPAWQKDYNQRVQERGTVRIFEGQGFTAVNPPDPTMDVGPNHVVQMINDGDGSIIQIWDKMGTVLMGSFLMDGITTIPGAGDPIVVYDHMADRWLLTEFGDIGNRLIAMVSTSPDPLGTYNVYEFVTPNFPDYPKYGLWPDAYLVTTNEGDAQAVYAMDRVNMLAGNPATIQRFTDLERFQTLNFQAATPVNLSGPTLPSGGEPGIIMRIADDGWTGVDDDRLEIWELTVDFATPANSMLTGPTNLLTDPFDTELCGFTAFACFQQPSGPQLDPLREVLMNKVFYRNFGTHETIVATHVTDVDGNDRGGVRWYELRRSGGPWQIFQQGTYAPDDGDSRWMAAIAINGDGSIGLAYNVSSTNTFPSLRYTGRTFCDPPGEMGIAETVIADGAGNNGSNRYGDYSDMNVDPVDGSFWFTGEYNPSSQWSTKMINFTVDLNCDVFELTTATASGEICPMESSVDYTIDVDFLGTYNAPVTLTTPDLPAGVTASFSPMVLNAPGSSTLTITDNSLAPGTYNFTVQGDGGGLMDVLPLELIHFESLPSAITLINPADAATGVAYNASLEWGADASAETYLLEVATDMAFTNLVVNQEVDDTVFPFFGILDPGTTYYWRVTGRNICGDGPASAEWSFTIQDVVQDCMTFNPGDLPQDILDNTTITSLVTASIGGIITDVNIIEVDLTHTFIGDLDIILESPEGTQVSVFARSCGTEENILAGFDDDGISPLPCPPTDGQSYVPATPLAAFNDELPTGDWTISVTDNAGQDEGIFNDWSLEICFLRPVFDCSAMTNLDGVIPSGSYNYPDEIMSSGTVPNLGNVIFRAPNGILLDPGFEVEEDGFFEAYLEACSED